VSRRKTKIAEFKAPAATVEKSKNLPFEQRMLIANAENDITIPYFTDVLLPVDDTLASRGGSKGLKIYDDIERDTHAWAVLQKRKKTMLAREWVVEPGGDRPLDIEAADFVRETFKRLPFDRICEDLLDATLKGFSISEVIWARQGNRIVPERIVSHNQRRFVFDQNWRPRLLTMCSMDKGEELPERKFIVHRHGVKGNNPYGLGLGTRLFWPVLFKREGVAFWLHFLDKFAGPTVVGKSPYGTLESDQRDLLNKLQAMRTKGAMVVPIGTDVGLLEATRGGSVSYREWCEYWDKQMSIATTGETLTTDIGNAGSRAASETHYEILELLVDADGDLQSDTLREQLITWMVEYNFPGAAVPNIWRVRPSSEKAKAETRKAAAEAAVAENGAIVTLLQAASHIADDEEARAYLVSFGVTAQLSDETIDRLVTARFAFAEGGSRAREIEDALKQAKKKVPVTDQLFAEPDHAVDLSDRLDDALADLLAEQLEDVRSAIFAVRSFEAAAAIVLKDCGHWKADPIAAQIGEALELAMLLGRQAVLDELAGADFADPEAFRQPFKEQIEFFRQKQPKPTKAFTDVIRGGHDRSFVIAGAINRDMLADFQNAIAEAMENGTTLRDFQNDFDRIVAKYGWTYKGERGWRTRVIFETNIRTAHMAGRLKQMRDPNVLKLRPFWEYIHGETRKPKVPRPHHQAWHGRILLNDDPWWNTHFPPNDFLCSCGVRTLSRRDLEKRGKTGPDKAPEPLMEAISDPVTGKLIEQPQGIGYGWDYQPGDQWERGLVPSALMDGAALTDGRMAVAVDTPEPIAELVAKARPFKSQQLGDGLPVEDYVNAFLMPFGAEIGRAVLFKDAAGDYVPVSDGFFRERSGDLKITKRDRSRITPLIAETLADPDEIWLGVGRKKDPVDDGEELIVDRRYIRVDPVSGILIVFEMGDRFWDAITSYMPADKKGRPHLGLLDKRRGGKLLYKRK